MPISLPFPILRYHYAQFYFPLDSIYWDNRNLEFQILMQTYGKQYEQKTFNVVVYLFKMLKILHVVGPMVIWSI